MFSNNCTTKRRHISAYWLITTFCMVLQLCIFKTYADPCKGMDPSTVETAKTLMMDCAKQFGATDFMEIPADKLPCFGKCVMAKKGIIDEKGQAHKENLMKTVTEVPAALRAELSKLLEACFQDDTSMIDPADATCTTYLPLAMCMHSAFSDVCQ